MRIIPIVALPNQSISVRVDDSRYDIKLKETRGVMMCDITRDDEVLLSGARIVAGTPILLYDYLEQGNFFIMTDGDELPEWSKFGITQSLIYLTAAECKALTPPPYSPVTYSFSPDVVPGLAGWWRADLSSSIIADTDGRVSAWNDLSGNGYHWTQSDNAKKPITGAEYQEGMNTLVFNNDVMLGNAGLNSLMNGDYTLYSIAANRVSGADGVLYNFAESGGNGTFFRNDFSNTSMKFATGDVDSNNFTYTASTDPAIVNIRRASALGKAWRNDQTGSSIAAANFTPSGIFLGAASDLGVPVNAKVMEVIFYVGAHSDERRAEINNYLARWM